MYENFCLDFGPLNLAQTYNFCEQLNQYLKEKEYADKVIYFYSSKSQQYCSNAAVLICSFLVLYENKTAEEAYKLIKSREHTFENFHDASDYPCPYVLTVKDCVDGLYRAKQLKFFKWPDFDAVEYEHYCDLDNGDLNWLVEGKFAAFAGPFEERKHYGNGYYSTIPSDYIEYFHQKNITAVIRLNKACYNARHFVEEGITHYHLFYPDGGNPPSRILKQFIDICERETGAIAVHCKAGLGRTGTCIGMYLMKHFDVTAKELIGWFRVVRPGTVIGPQQDFLERHEARMITAGETAGLDRQVRESKEEDEVNIAGRKSEKEDGVRLGGSFSSFRGMDKLGEETQGDILNRLKAEHKPKKP